MAKIIAISNDGDAIVKLKRADIEVLQDLLYCVWGDSVKGRRAIKLSDKLDRAFKPLETSPLILGGGSISWPEEDYENQD